MECMCNPGLCLNRPATAPSYRKGGPVNASSSSTQQHKVRPTSAYASGRLTQQPPRTFVDPYPTDPYGEPPELPKRSPKLVMDFGKQLGHNLGTFIKARDLTAEVRYSPQDSRDSTSRRIPGFTFDGQAGRDATTAVIEANTVHMSDAVYNPQTTLTTKSDTSFVAMDKAITREQRAKGLARYNSTGVNASLPWYDSKETPKHIPAPNMAIGSERLTVFAIAAKKGAAGCEANHIFYDVSWKTQETERKAAVEFQKGEGRKRPSSTMGRSGGGKPVRDLDYALKVSHKAAERHKPGVNMKKQLTRDQATLSRRDVCRKTWMEEALPLRVKYSAVDTKPPTTTSFNKQLYRDQHHTAINDRKRRLSRNNDTVTSDQIDIHKSFLATRSNIKGSVSMARSGPRFGKPGSRLMVGKQSESVNKAIYKQERTHIKDSSFDDSLDTPASTPLIRRRRHFHVIDDDDEDNSTTTASPTHAGGRQAFGAGDNSHTQSPDDGSGGSARLADAEDTLESAPESPSAQLNSSSHSTGKLFDATQAPVQQQLPQGDHEGIEVRMHELGAGLPTGGEDVMKSPGGNDDPINV